MFARARSGLAVLVLSMAALFDGVSAAGEVHWPGFRGTGDSRTSVENLPLTWGDEEHLAWTCELPGYGQSSPVVWGRRAFATSVKGANKETLAVTCVDVRNGQRLWTKEFPSSVPAEATDYISQAAPTPVVDARGVYAFFESGDLLALSHDGQQLWARSLTKEYGDFQGNHGLGSSPAQSDDAVFVLVDHSGPSYLLSIDKRTGKTNWKKDREPRTSWSSPILTAGRKGPELLISSNGVAQAIDARTGDVLWEVGGLDGNTVASPSATEEAVLIGSGKPGDNLLIRRGGRGDVADSHIAWRAEGVSSSFGSPLLHRGRAYFVNKAGVAFAVDAKDGRVLWSERVADSTWASPVGAGERVYLFCKNGVTLVLKAGDEFKKLAENTLTLDGRLYGVAVIDGGFLLRSGRMLVCVRAE